MRNASGWSKILPKPRTQPRLQSPQRAGSWPPQATTRAAGHCDVSRSPEGAAWSILSGQRDVSRATHATARLTQGLDKCWLSREIESGVLEPRNETVDLGTLLTEFAEQCRPIAEQKGLLLRLVPTKARIQTNVQLLGHILQNLISNAIKYTEKGRILIGCRRRRGMILIEYQQRYRDSRQHLDRIFEEFHRVDGSRSDGLGLGLAIAKRMAVLMGHRLTVRSRPGKGTCFSVEVPLVEGQIP